MKTSTTLIAETNNFLDRLHPPQTIKEVQTNIKFLAKAKEQMLKVGFNATFPEMMIAVNKEFGEDMSDLPKQLAAFREFANMKRYVLRRASVALTSHKILFNCLQRGTTYEFTQYLPYNGEYLFNIVSLGEPAVRTYKHMLGLATTRKNDDSEEYTVTLLINGEKKKYKLHSDKDIEKKILKAYGKDAVIVDVRKLTREPPLVKSNSTRVALAAAYVKLSATRVYGKKLATQMPQEHQKYASILSKYGLSSDTRLDLMEGHDELKDKLYSTGLMSNSMDSLKLDTGVMESISKKRAVYNKLTIKEAERQFAFDVFHFFITEPKRIRSSLPLFPGISTEVNAKQYTFLKALDIQDPIDIVERKINLESSGPTMPGKLMGVTFLHLCGKSIEWCAQTFNVAKDEIRIAASKLSPYLGTKKSDQAKKFLELIES